MVLGLYAEYVSYIFESVKNTWVRYSRSRETKKKHWLKPILGYVHWIVLYI